MKKREFKGKHKSKRWTGMRTIGFDATVSSLADSLILYSFEYGNARCLSLIKGQNS